MAAIQKTSLQREERTEQLNLQYIKSVRIMKKKISKFIL
jgi:hypothetical protein